MSIAVHKDLKQLLKRHPEARLEARGRSGGIPMIVAADGSKRIAKGDVRALSRWLDSCQVIAEVTPTVVSAREPRDIDNDRQYGIKRDQREKSIKACARIRNDAKRVLPDDRERLLAELGWK